MKIILTAIIAILLTGCMTTYSVERQMPDGSYIKVVTKSFRKFEQPVLEYETTDGTVFRFNAASASTDYSPVEYAAADILSKVATGAVSIATGPPQ